MTGAGLALALWIALPARADVSLVQVVQTQAGAGDEGQLAKSLLEVSREKMRLVTAVVRRDGDGPDEHAPPWRMVEVLELATTSVLLIDPEARTWERRGLDRLHHGPPVGAGPRRFDVVAASVSVRPGTLVRRCLGADCSHYHVAADVTLRDRRGKRSRARLEQDIWMAPLTGTAQKGLLDLIAFEAEFRRQTGSALSPVDHQTYRVAEAARSLGVGREDLEGVVAKVRRALQEVPGYPLVSSVAWWSDRDRRAAPKTRKPRAEPKLLQDPPPAAPRPRRAFVRIDWHGGWKKLDSALARAQAGLPGLRQAPEAPPAAVLEGYEAFRTELAAVIEQLDRARAAPRPAPALPAEQGDLTRPPPPDAREGGPAASRAYESFSEIGELIFINQIPDERFRPPAGFRPK
ncbi:MAG: hypothetical protein HY553_01625 [Elusimicrobia bacterium]|nr:hypothetical protein [Elusimicrobiota bacterium]